MSLSLDIGNKSLSSLPLVLTSEICCLFSPVQVYILHMDSVYNSNQIWYALMFCHEEIVNNGSIVACADMYYVQLYMYFDGNGHHIGCYQYLYIL